MKISTRLAIQSTILSCVAALFLLLLVSYQMRNYALTEATERARLILAEKQALIQYVVNNLRPALSKNISDLISESDHFDPTWMSAGYINRTIHHYFNTSGFDDYYYKNAAINARNPENEASSYEVSFLREAGRNKEHPPKVEVVRIDGAPFLVYMEVNRSSFDSRCMGCHSTPEMAPLDLVALYGAERGYYKKEGDIASVLSLRIPLGKTYSYVESLTIKIVGALVFILVITFMVQWLLTHRAVVLPLCRITDKARQISNDDRLLGDSIAIAGSSELSEMASVFTDMSVRLAEKKKLLEKDVEDKTTKLTEARIRYRTLFETMQEGFALHELLYDRDGNAIDYRFLAVNPSFERLTGLKSDDVIRKTVLEVLPDTEKYWIDMAAQVVRTNIPTQYENYARGLGKFFDSVIFKVEEDRFAVMFRDVTERRRAEEKAVVLEEKLKQAHKMEALGTLAGGIAHDFNNILSAILGYAEMAGEDVPNTHPAHRKISKIEQAGNRAKEMVAHILAFSRKGDHRKELVAPALVVKEAIALLRVSIPSNIDIQTDIRLDAEKVFIDPTQLHQVVMNLCTNAYQAMEKDGGELMLTLTRTKLDAKDLAGEYSMSPGEYIHLSIHDTGPGICEEIKGLIFDPYFTTKEVGKGTGMGLSVAHGIIKSCGGLITAESSPGDGATFNVYLPQAHDEAVKVVDKIDEIPLAGCGHIMVVDDEHDLVEMTSLRLRRLGYDVSPFTSSKDALSAFLNDPYIYDAVVTDQTMPKLTGDMLAEKILGIRPELPIILCTGYSSRVDKEMAMQVGIRAFVMKPVGQAVLADTLQDLLGG